MNWGCKLELSEFLKSVSVSKSGKASYAKSAKERITLTSLFGRELEAIEIIEFFGSHHHQLKVMCTFSKI
jgi:hypothetical protein